MKILNQKAGQVILVNFDEVPITKLAHRSNAEKLANLLQFEATETIRDNAGNFLAVGFRNGLFKTEENECVVSRLVIEERKFVFEVDGTTADADAFFIALSDILANIADKSRVVEDTFLQPLITANETEIVAHLKVPFEKLFGPSYLRFVKSMVVDKASTEIADARVIPTTTAFSVDYLVKDHSLNDRRINLSRKELVIGARKGHPLEEQIYFSKAPFDTETHIQLLEDLEALLSKNDY
jgi:hypothetical protein